MNFFQQITLFHGYIYIMKKLVDLVNRLRSIRLYLARRAKLRNYSKIESFKY